MASKNPVKVPQDHQKPKQSQVKKRYCPFKKVTDVEYKQISEDNPDLINTAEIEHFGECIEGLCMAFNKETRQCKLINKEETNGEANNKI
jgi:hypothetical protein